MSRISSLQNAALSVVTSNCKRYGDDLQKLPFTLKNYLTKLMMRRGCFDRTLLRMCITANISALDLTNCTVDNLTLKLISQVCKRLSSVNLNTIRGNRTDVTSEGILCLANECKQLNTVFLRGCENVEDKAVIALAENCHFLKRLNVQGTKITDATLLSLANLHYLESINFSFSPVTDAGIHALCIGPCAHSLYDVDMSECRNLTDDSVQFVSVMCPKLETLIFHGCTKMTDCSRAVLDDFVRTAVVKQITWTIY